MPWPTCGLRSGMWVELSAEYPHLKLKLWNPEGPSQAIDGFCAEKLRKRRVPDPLRHPLRPPFNGVADFPQGSSLKLDHPLPSQVFLIFRVLYLEAIGLDHVLHLPEVLDGAHGVGYVQSEVSGFTTYEQESSDLQGGDELPTEKFINSGDIKISTRGQWGIC